MQFIKNIINKIKERKNDSIVRRNKRRSDPSRRYSQSYSFDSLIFPTDSIFSSSDYKASRTFSM